MAVAVTLAWPAASVVACAADRVAEAPEPGTVNVTVTPLTGLLEASRTNTTKGLANAVEMVVLCGVPPEAAIDVGLPAVTVKALLCADANDVAEAINW